MRDEQAVLSATHSPDPEKGWRRKCEPLPCLLPPQKQQFFLCEAVWIGSRLSEPFLRRSWLWVRADTLRASHELPRGGRMGKFQRNKGASNEREACRMWREIGYPEARRKLSQYQERCGVDLENTGNFKVQVKSGKRIDVWKALQEAEKESKAGDMPLVMAKKDRFGWIVVLNWIDFVKFF
ncbi:MAG: hypothetical protein KatS3mg101_0936 [Patescibacteria group bacterium]|nr:MAG: hypothetical protein KatS3mg101_0936 [Patescibacteria group bacterium]